MRGRLAAVTLLVLALTGCGSGTPLPTVQHFADPAVLDVQAQTHGYLGALDALLLRRQTHLAYLTAVAQGDTTVHRPSRAARQLASALDGLRADFMGLPAPPAQE